MASTATKSTSFRQTMLFLMTFLLVLLLEPCRSQSSSNNNYDNYGYEGDGAGDGYGSDAPDNLYHDYAARQQEKGVG